MEGLKENRRGIVFLQPVTTVTTERLTLTEHLLYARHLGKPFAFIIPCNSRTTLRGRNQPLTHFSYKEVGSERLAH